MIQLAVLGWSLEVDRETTRRFTQTLSFLTDPCDCVPCQNFQAALAQLPAPLLDLLEQLGSSPGKPAEIYYCAPHEDGTHKYGGWYHVTGQILGGWDEPTGWHYEPLSEQVARRSAITRWRSSRRSAIPRCSSSARSHRQPLRSSRSSSGRTPPAR